MENHFWHERWENNQIGFHQDEINSYLRHHWPSLEVPANSRIFVPLCGKSKDMLWLRDQGYEVTGIEISPIAVQDFFTENGLTPKISECGPLTQYSIDRLTIWCGDFFKLQPEQLEGCTAVYDRASLVALPPPMRKSYVAQLQQIQPSPLPTLLVSLEYEQSEMSGPPFAVQQEEIETLYRSHYSIQPLETIDVLPENPQFERRGLTSLLEKIYRLDPG